MQVTSGHGQCLLAIAGCIEPLSRSVHDVCTSPLESPVKAHETKNRGKRITSVHQLASAEPIPI
jgi:hypothetical protein